MHDGGGDRQSTMAALPRLIDGLRGAGFELVAVSTLLGETRDETMPRLGRIDRWMARANTLVFDAFRGLRLGRRRGMPDGDRFDRRAIARRRDLSRFCTDADRSPRSSGGIPASSERSHTRLRRGGGDRLPRSIRCSGRTTPTSR